MFSKQRSNSGGATREGGGHYFLLPKKREDFCPILDLAILEFSKHFKVLQVLNACSMSPVMSSALFTSVNLPDAYCHNPLRAQEILVVSIQGIAKKF